MQRDYQSIGLLHTLNHQAEQLASHRYRIKGYLKLIGKSKARFIPKKRARFKQSAKKQQIFYNFVRFGLRIAHLIKA